MEHLELTPDELCAVAQGLRAHICQRLYWMMSPRHPIRGEDFDDEAATLNWMVQAYSKTMMVARDSKAVVDEWKEYFMLSQEAWDMLALVAMAKDWDDIPVHQHVSALGCALCDELVTAV
jgi:hypothetical protein